MHTLYCGVTLSGKTTLARINARALRRAHQAVIVYDPVGTSTVGGDWGKGVPVHHDEEKFWQHILASKAPRTHLFIDEAGDLFNNARKENHWLLTRGRHYGYSVHLITQRPKMLAPSVRTQCGRCYMFRLAIEDADEIGRDFGHSKISNEKLDRGEFLILDSGRDAYRRSRLPYQLSSPKGT